MIRLGRISYVNMAPVFYRLDHEVEEVTGVPTDLNRRLIAGAWTYPHRGVGRPPLDDAVQQLILRLARENPRWGYQRIRGELLKLVISVSATTVRSVLLRRGPDPAPRRGGPTWNEFLRSQAKDILDIVFHGILSDRERACRKLG